MATKKSFYQMMKEGPETWLQDALDAHEISEAERDAIQKFIESQTREEAEKQMDVLRAAMANRPEFALSQDEREEIAKTVDSIDKSRRQLQEDIQQLLAKQAAINRAGEEQTLLTAEQKEELDTITQTLQERYKELSEETKRFSAYSMIQALATSEQAQEQANKWYEEIGRDQGLHLLTALGEYAQVAVHALIPGHKEQVQEHLQKAEAASGRHQAAVARGFETQARQMEPSRKERREDNKLTRQANKQIKKVQAASQSVKRWQDEALRMANKIILTEYRQRNMFANIPGWSQGTPVNTTYQKITDPQLALQFLEEHGVRQASDIADKLQRAQEHLAEEKKTLDTVMSPMLRKLDARQQALIDFKRDYEHAATHGHVGMQRADNIFEHVAEATKYAIFTPQFIEKLERAGVEIDNKYRVVQDPAQRAPEKPEQRHTGPTPVAPTHNGPAGTTGPTHTNPTPVAPTHNTQSHATISWDDVVRRVEEKNKPLEPLYVGLYLNGKADVMQLSNIAAERQKQFNHLKANRIGYTVLKEDQVQAFKDKAAQRKQEQEIKKQEQDRIRNIKNQGKALLPQEKQQEWTALVDKLTTNKAPQYIESNKNALEASLELAELVAKGASVQEVLEHINEMTDRGVPAMTIEDGLAINKQQFPNPVIGETIEFITEFRGHMPEGPETANKFPDQETIDLYFTNEPSLEQEGTEGQEADDLEQEEEQTFGQDL